MTKTEAIVYITQALNDYAATMPASVKGLFLVHAQQAIRTLEAKDAPADAAESKNGG
jgi:hypothetical protein